METFSQYQSQGTLGLTHLKAIDEKIAAHISHLSNQLREQSERIAASVSQSNPDRLRLLTEILDDVAVVLNDFAANLETASNGYQSIALKTVDLLKEAAVRLLPRMSGELRESVQSMRDAITGARTSLSEKRNSMVELRSSIANLPQATPSMETAIERTLEVMDRQEKDAGDAIHAFISLEGRYDLLLDSVRRQQ